MSLPSPIQKALDPLEDVVWTGQPYTPEGLLEYRGWHRVVGIAFIATAIALAIMSWTNRAEIDGAATVGLLILIVTPLVFGFGFWFGFSWVQRDARQKTHYAVTDKRVLVVNKHGNHGHTLQPNTDIQHKVGKFGIDKIQFDQTKAFLLTHDNAVAAFAALQDLRGSANE